MSKDFTHFNDEGRAKMVNVGDKDVTHRKARAQSRVFVNRETFDLIKSGGVKKGDVLTVAQVAGIMGAKKTKDIIPMCHPILMDGIDLSLSLNEDDLSVDITSEVSCDGLTGVYDTPPPPMSACLINPAEYTEIFTEKDKRMRRHPDRSYDEQFI